MIHTLSCTCTRRYIHRELFLLISTGHFAITLLHWKKFAGDLHYIITSGKSAGHFAITLLQICRSFLLLRYAGHFCYYVMQVIFAITLLHRENLLSYYLRPVQSSPVH